jgi:murein DD-endopeptidase MepM/ murein hydrolase activator NlpD
MKRNIYVHPPRAVSRRTRWRSILLVVIFILVLPKAGWLLSSQLSDGQLTDIFRSKPSAEVEQAAKREQVPKQKAVAAEQDISGEQVSVAMMDASLEHEQKTDSSARIVEQVMKVSRGDTLMGILRRAGLDRFTAHEAITALQEVYDPRDLRPGHEMALLFRGEPADGAGGEPAELFDGLRIQVDVDRNVRVRRVDKGKFEGEEESWQLEVVQDASQGKIQSSLYEAALDAGLPLPVLMQMIRAYSFDVDFQRDIHPGDRFAALFERQVDEQGNALRDGPVLFATLETSGRTLPIYRYTALDGEVDYFDPQGKSVRKTLMLTPIDGARLSSGYGIRRHPILGYNRMHRGLDFAAPSGTPIMAAGSGVVTHAGRKGNYGITVKLRHANEYTTLYAHMRSIARGVRVGARVEQGDVIGYVGSTGMSTGPHLHYEVHHRGKFVNPAKVNSPPGRTLTGEDLHRFQQVREELEGHYAALSGKMLATAKD